MKHYAVSLAVMFILLLASTHSKIGVAWADQAQTATYYQKADLKNGAQLFDNWLKITGTNPEGSHPLYPSEAKKSGTSTWRCKECHGWDYLGNKGRYSKGSHYTGITGVYLVRNQDPAIIYNSLAGENAQHDFSVYLSRSQTWNLVKFLREGQVAIEPAIDSQGQARGDSTQGRTLYTTNCSSCHEADGNGIDFKSDKDGVQGVGWLANDNPQESMHKIRWGHPGSDMPSMIADKNLSDQDAIDILAYSQMLGSSK